MARLRSLLTLAVLPLAFACSESKSAEQRPSDAGTDTGQTLPVPKLEFANAFAPDSEHWAGQEILFKESWGLETDYIYPPADFMVSLYRNEPELFGVQFERFGFIPDDQDDLPLGLKRGTQDRTRVFENCILCHSQKLADGKVWIGAPNVRIRRGEFRVLVAERWAAAGNTPIESAEGLDKQARIGTARMNAERDGQPLIPDDIPVMYDMLKGTTFSKLGTTTEWRSEVYLSMFGTGVGAPSEAETKHPFPPESSLAPFVAAFGSYTAPPPAAGDAAAIAAGKALFDRERCGSCHTGRATDGVTPVDAAGVERLPGDDAAFPRGSIGTDPFHFDQLIGNSTGDGGAGDGGFVVDPSYANFIQFIIKYQLKVRRGDGYRVPDLRAIDLSAPYLHNGSVPTLEALLTRAADRPEQFQLPDGSTRDTTQQGNGNGGHEFGATLGAAERAQLIAYLRSL